MSAVPDPHPARLLVVLRAPRAEDYAPVVDALVRGGVSAVEVTLSTPRTIEELPRLVDRFGADARIGVGTVTDAGEAARAVDAGAAFLVTPVVHPEVVRVARDAGLPVYPGAFSPTEVLRAWQTGATAVKVFPASLGGPQYFRDLAGPFPHIPLVPSGGVRTEDVAEWFAAGAAAVSIGGPLIGDAFRGGDLEDLTRRSAEVVAAVAACTAS
jgi:2-dehydro-3-deoxyphosphogluconate aldolase/(4S)-4-hydroxy-2-oxoglutarate aldolase